MSEKATLAAQMIASLPESEQNLAFELIKRLVLAWDPDYVKLTEAERTELEAAEQEEFIDDSSVDWENLSQYNSSEK